MTQREFEARIEEERLRLAIELASIEPSPICAMLDMIERDTKVKARQQRMAEDAWAKTGKLAYPQSCVYAESGETLIVETPSCVEAEKMRRKMPAILATVRDAGCRWAVKIRVLSVSERPGSSESGE